MANIFWKCVAYLFRFFFSLRYTIEVRGLEKLKTIGTEGILFFPTHPALIEPIMLYAYLWIPYKMRPLAVDYIYRLPLLKPFIKAARAISIPNFETSVNQLKIREGERAMQEILKGLQKGENFLFYPSGRLKGGGKEIIGGASGAHDLVEKAPKAKVVLIRTTGLWGSSFSRAGQEKSPSVVSTFLHGVKVLLKNFIFFAPRRKVLIEIEPEPEDFPRGKSRIEFNRYLENWYNRYPDEKGQRQSAEPLNLVSYSRFRTEYLAIHDRVAKEKGSKGVISEAVSTKIYGVLRKILDRPDQEITPDMSLPLDLGMDSLNIAELITFLARNYSVEEIHPEDVETVQQVLEIAQGLTKKRDLNRVKQSIGFTWPKEKVRPPIGIASGNTIPEVFFNTCKKMGNTFAAGDDLVGPLRYPRMKKSILVLANHFAKWPGQRIGVMLPASLGAFVVILALQTAGKTPVMLNWTLGARYLEEMVKLAGVRQVISSWRFLDRLSHVDFGSLIDQLVLLEDVRSRLSLSEKLKGAFLSFCSTKTILSSNPLKDIKAESEAVILFTSGTEAVPKGVPLTHRNILSNLRDMLDSVKLCQNDTIYAVLPPFHSFGFSVAGLTPLLSGMKVAFYPDPTDSFGIAEGIERWKITLFCAAPSFVKGVLYAAKEGQLKSVKLFVTGAEKAPEELFKRVEKLSQGAVLVEGYGITECSPVLTLNRPNQPAKGVGEFLPSIEAKTIHPETLKPLAEGEEGEVCVRGPNVFKGYLGNPRNPFIMLDGKQWYRTGDLGIIHNRWLTLSGRLKRFVKLGGEMISLMAIEEIIQQELIRKKIVSVDTSSLAVVADERDPEKPQLILFTAVPLEKESVNEMLKGAGLSRLVKIHAVRLIDEIPLLGTGKINFRALQEKIV